MASTFTDKLKDGDVAGLLRRHADVLLAILVVSIVGMMIVPLPTFLLDLLITLNIAGAVVLLMVSIYVANALRISSFPTILLITTLFRLALNVSSTRLILLQADAGDVIRAFGEFVVRGNFVVGAIIFLILTLIQFIVISKGSERVAEVAARFTLDAMPGKQMAIDAELRSGHIDQDEARRRRGALGRESQLYGSMDGAMKFVKGDAIAGIVITVVNIVGGLIIGVVQRGMTAGEALHVYSLLTIGDGLVSQIPALVISTAAGLIVTRVASEEEGSHLGADIGAQILAQPKAIAITSGLLVVLALVPGLPKIPFLLLAAVTGGLAWSIRRSALVGSDGRATRAARLAGFARRSGTDERAGAPSTGLAVAAGGSADEDLSPTGVVPVALELAEDLAAAAGVEGKTGGRFVAEIVPQLRRTLYQELGVLLPGVRVRRVIGMAPGSWRLRLSEVPVLDGLVPPGKRLVGESPARLEPLGLVGEAARHPERRPASWIADDAATAPATAALLAQAGIPTWDAAGVLALHVGAALRRYAHELLGIQEAQRLLDALEKTHPTLVREVVPKLVSPQLLTDVLRRLVEEQVSIRDLRAILGALADWARAEKDPVLLTEYVRAALKRQVTFQHTRGGRTLPVYLLDAPIEEAIRGAITKTQTGAFLALEPEISQDILGAVRRTVAARAPSAAPPVVLTSMEIRRFVKRLVEIEHPEIAVVSFQELLGDVNVQPVGRIAVS